MNARQAEEAGLLERYAPVLRFHPQEPYRADSPAIMANAALEGKRGTQLRDGAGKLVASALGVPGVPLLNLDYLGAAYPGGPAATAKDRLVPNQGTWEQDARAMRQLPLLADRLYAAARQQDGGRVWLQYWLFYYFNDKSVAGIGLHDGDWEMIQLGLDNHGHPEFVTFAQHTGGERRKWADVKKLDDEPDAPPIVYVGLGSHASFFRPGEYWIKPFPVRDHVVDGDEVRPAVERLSGMRWLDWPGKWGSKDAPDGPKQHTQWGGPDGWHLSRNVRNPRTRKVLGTYLALPEGEVAPPLSVHAQQQAGRVAVRWQLPELDAAGANVPVRLLVSVKRAGTGDPALTRTRAVTEPEGIDELPVPPGEGPLVAIVSAYDAQDSGSVPIEAAVTEAAPAPARAVRFGGPAVDGRAERPESAAAPVRLLVRLPEDAGAAEQLRQDVAAALRTDELGAPWRVAPLFPADGVTPPSLARYYTVTGRLPGGALTPLPASAFEAAARLAAATGLEVHPDLPSSPLVEPPPRAGARGDRRAAAAEADAEWPLRILKCREAWRIEPTKGAGARIAQPDTGVTRHPMLDTPALARAEGFDVLDGDDDPTDPLTRHWWRLIQNPGHGTATASVIVAPGQDMFGAAPGATLIPIRCITGVVQVLDGDVALAIEAARRLRVDVITMSIGGEGFFPVLADALAAAVADGIVVLAAGGNYAPFVPAPARLRDCLAVAATGEDGRPWEFSSPGPEIDWAAPGSGLLVARAKLESGRPVYRVAPGAGSSFAVAHTAAVAALWVTHHGRDALRAKYPGAVQWAFREVATASVQPGTGWGPGDGYGAGILDAEAVLRCALPDDPAPPRALRAATTPVAPLLPELAPEQQEERLAELFGVGRPGLDELMRAHAGELVYHLIEDRVLRHELAAGSLVRARERLATVASNDLGALLLTAAER